MSGEVRCVDAAVVSELAKHRREQTAGPAGMMQTKNGVAFVETAARWIRSPEMNLSAAALSVGPPNMNDGRLWQWQTISMLRVDH